MSSILALPPPSGLPASTTFGRARALLGEDALPVTPIRSVPDEGRRRQLREAARRDGESGGAEDADANAGPVGDARNRNRSAAAGGFTGSAAGEGPTPAGETPRIELQTRNAGPVAGFVTQSLYQESVGSGLHIEPWAQALGAYRRADSVGSAGGGRAQSGGAGFTV